MQTSLGAEDIIGIIKRDDLNNDTLTANAFLFIYMVVNEIKSAVRPNSISERSALEILSKHFHRCFNSTALDGNTVVSLYKAGKHEGMKRVEAKGWVFGYFERLLTTSSGLNMLHERLSTKYTLDQVTQIADAILRIHNLRFSHIAQREIKVGGTGLVSGVTMTTHTAEKSTSFFCGTKYLVEYLNFENTLKLKAYIKEMFQHAIQATNMNIEKGAEVLFEVYDAISDVWGYIRSVKPTGIDWKSFVLDLVKNIHNIDKTTVVQQCIRTISSNRLGGYISPDSWTLKTMVPDDKQKDDIIIRGRMDEMFGNKYFNNNTNFYDLLRQFIMSSSDLFTELAALRMLPDERIVKNAIFIELTFTLYMYSIVTFAKTHAYFDMYFQFLSTSESSVSKYKYLRNFGLIVHVTNTELKTTRIFPTYEKVIVTKLYPHWGNRMAELSGHNDFKINADFLNCLSYMCKMATNGDEHGIQNKLTDQQVNEILQSFYQQYKASHVTANTTTNSYANTTPAVLGAAMASLFATSQLATAGQAFSGDLSVGEGVNFLGLIFGMVDAVLGQDGGQPQKRLRYNSRQYKLRVDKNGNNYVLVKNERILLASIRGKYRYIK